MPRRAFWAARLFHLWDQAGIAMKVTVERAQLVKSLGHVHRVVERRNTIPILGNVLVRAESARLSLKATDLDLEVTETLPAEAATAGSTTVPAHMFYDIVRKLPDGAQILLEGDGDRSVLAIRAGRSRFTLQTLPENDFPDLAAGDMTHSFTLAASDMKRLIDRTQFAISTEETRYYLNGIYLHTAGSAKAATLRAVATDGHRLAQLDLALPKGASGMPGVIVPRKTVGEVQRLIEDNEGEVKIELSQGKIRFTIGDVVLTSKLIDGTFPDYGRVIPQNNDKELMRMRLYQFPASRMLISPLPLRERVAPHEVRRQVRGSCRKRHTIGRPPNASAISQKGCAASLPKLRQPCGACSAIDGLRFSNFVAKSPSRTLFSTSSVSKSASLSKSMAVSMRRPGVIQRGIRPDGRRIPD